MLSQKEVLAFLHISGQTFDLLRKNDEEFPKPLSSIITKTKRGNFWSKEELEEQLENNVNYQIWINRTKQ